jgi:hypothetical protein
MNQSLITKSEQELETNQHVGLCTWGTVQILCDYIFVNEEHVIRDPKNKGKVK